MNYPSPQDVEEMPARGYGPSVIEEALALSKRWAEKEQLKEQIRHAFAGVQLGHGAGLREAQGLDDHAGEQKCADHRASDEKLDWQALRQEDLNECHSSLSFFDAEGMRFHLPAYLIVDLDGCYGFGMVFTLAQAHLRGEKFALLDKAQHAAVRAYLRFVEHEPDYALDRQHIQQALAGFWAE